jgi:glutaminase
MQCDPSVIQQALDFAVAHARRNQLGLPASYIPELAQVDLEALSAAVTLVDGTVVVSGDHATHHFTFQSSAKLVVLAALLEERGPVEVFAVVGSEPSGDNFGSLARLETHGPKPANPFINSGAIGLCGQLSGSLESRLAWVTRWAERLYGSQVGIDEKVFLSERSTADRNRAIAHLLKAGGVIKGDLEPTLDAYFALCSLTGSVAQVAGLPALLANGGVRPGSGERVLSPATVAIVVSLMATCGMYNESGNYLVSTGMPAKSGVSGVIVAVVPGVAGIAVSSPRLNDKGGSIRGHLILRELSRKLGWHFALAASEHRGGPAPQGSGREAADEQDARRQ